jgi:hypothetical protein
VATAGPACVGVTVPGALAQRHGAAAAGLLRSHYRLLVGLGHRRPAWSAAAQMVTGELNGASSATSSPEELRAMQSTSRGGQLCSSVAYGVLKHSQMSAKM